MKCDSIRKTLSLLTVVLLAASTSSFADNPGQRGRPAPPHFSPPRQSAPVFHAQREPVRTNNFVRPPSAPRQTQRLPVVRSSQGSITNHPWQTRLQATNSVRDGRSFTRTANGRLYDNGLHLSRGVQVTSGWEKPYFPNGHAHYTHYWHNNYQGTGYVSPYACYWGVCAPWLNSEYCFPFPPAVNFIDFPVYDGNDFTYWLTGTGENWLDRPNLEDTNPGLSNAIDELEEAFVSGNIDALVSLIDPNVQIAVYEQGKYQYSIPASDYIDLTRDAIDNIHTVSLTLSDLHQKAPNVYCVSGRHQYKDGAGTALTNYLSFVLQDFSGQWTLTQVDTCPGVARKIG